MQVVNISRIEEVGNKTHGITLAVIRHNNLTLIVIFLNDIHTVLIIRMKCYFKQPALV